MSRTILAIDPGPTRSAAIIYDAYRRSVGGMWLTENEKISSDLRSGYFADCDYLAIEMVAHYGTGMPAGKTIFDTAAWIGRFIEAWGGHYRMVYRCEVKLHLCGSVRAKDGNIRQVLIDRYGGSTKAAKGTKANPGPLYGIKADIWQALAVAVTADETEVGDV